MSEFRFEHPELLLLFILVAAMTIGYVLHRRWREVARVRMAESSLLRRIQPLAPKSKYGLKAGLAIAAASFGIFALANPQFQSGIEERNREGLDIALALDVSKSMDAEDVMPSRLSVAKASVKELMKKESGNRYSLIAFAGNAYMQMPLSSDHSAAALFLSSLNTSYMPTQGTDILAALEMANDALTVTKKKDEIDPPPGLVVLISDGEDHETDVQACIDYAQSNNLKVYALGVGTSEGGPIPEYRNGRKIGYKDDRVGNPVITKLESKALSAICNQTGGQFFDISRRKALDALISEIQSEEKAIYGAVSTALYASFFHIPLIICVLLMFLFIAVDYKRNKGIFTSSLFKTSIIVIGFFCLHNLNAQTSKEKIELYKANKEIQDTLIEQANSRLKSLIESSPKQGQAWFNQGNLKFMQGDTNSAIQSYAKATEFLKGEERAKAFHNLGNMLASKQQWGEAVKSYANAVKLNPNDEDSKYNLNLALSKLKQQQQQQQQQQKDQNKDQNQKQQQQQQQEEQDKEEQQQQQQQKQKIDQKQAEQLLKQLENSEKELLENMQKKKGKGKKRKTEKDW